jgi:hypothetical protein
VLGSPITLLLLENAAGKVIVQIYHHNYGDEWILYTTPSSTGSTTQWVVGQPNGVATGYPGFFYTAGSPSPYAFAVPYGTWGHLVVTRIGTQLSFTLSPLGGIGQTCTWVNPNPCMKDPVAIIGLATRFSPGACYWKNVLVTE